MKEQRLTYVESKIQKAKNRELIALKFRNKILRDKSTISKALERRLTVKESENQVQTIIDVDAQQSESEKITMHNNIKIKEEKSINETTMQHIDSLMEYRMKCFVNNTFDDVKWDEYVLEFYETILNKDMFITKDVIVGTINNIVTRKYVNYDKIMNFTEDMTGLDYEIFCSELLSNSGWTSFVTKASGDQGVDVVATRNRCFLAVQCKIYSKPVDNKAVQAVFAGKKYYEVCQGLDETAYNTSIAIVVTNNAFTLFAVELAEKLNVKLMHHRELSKY